MIYIYLFIYFSTAIALLVTFTGRYLATCGVARRSPGGRAGVEQVLCCQQGVSCFKAGEKWRLTSRDQPKELTWLAGKSTNGARNRNRGFQ